MNTLVYMLALAILAVATWQGSTVAGGTPRRRELPPERNLGLATDVSPWFQAHGNRVLVLVDEQAQGQGSLNGDGDVTDDVLVWLDLASGASRNLGAGGFGGTWVGERALFWLSEPGDGAIDYNGDGDTNDLVFHSFDGTTLTNLGLSGLLIGANERLALFEVTESWQGQDRNGDGDLLDQVGCIYDGDTGALTSFGFALGSSPTLAVSLSVIGTELAILVGSEAAQGGVDGNGDGDALDMLPVVVELDSFSQTFLPLAVDRDTFPTSAGSLVAFSLSEADQGVDANGDGDQTDFIAHVRDQAAGVTRNTQVAVAFLGFPPRHEVLAGRGFAAFLGADGLHVHDAVSGTTTATGLFASQLVVHGATLAALVGEGSLDLNGDGDATDRVLHVLEAPGFLPRNLGLSGHSAARFGRDWLGFSVSEVTQGFQDRNGDGDRSDDVLAFFDLRRDRWLDLGIDGNVAAAARDLGLTYVSERDQSQDLNGDGDLLDTHQLLFQASTGWRAWILDFPQGTLLDEDWLTFIRRESIEGADLNGDGDQLDKVLHVRSVRAP